MVTLQTNGGKDNALPSVNGAGTIGYDNREKEKSKTEFVTPTSQYTDTKINYG